MAGKITIVIDNGSYCVKAGFGGGSEPKSIFTNLTASDDQEQTYKRIFEEELGVPSEGQTVLITDHLLSTKESREKTAEIMFKKLNVQNLFIGYDAVLALYATGRQEGIVVDIGHKHAYVVPIVKGFAVSSAVTKSEITGEALDRFLASGLREKGHTKLTHGKLVRQIKEKFCIVASDNSHLTYSPAKMFLMPDGKQAETIHYEWAKCAEALFNPALTGSNSDGIHLLIKKAIEQCDTAVQATLWSNVVLSSGTTQFPGFSERLQKELTTLAPANVPTKVIFANTSLGTWVGGSILVSLSQMAEMFVTKEEYEKDGAAALHKKWP